ncbi:BCCT family transporter [uncultured Algimonas sp.]|uniref:BCCT family transporter n=1 Tax=uncultured Algimonas sp. TaxID=1547920 RepID=UPI002632B8E0|nr:BCCT family transporter [uncultured Algimonas sp.]
MTDRTLGQLFRAYRLRPRVFALPLSAFAALILTSLLAPGPFLGAATALNTAILNVFSHGFTVAAFLFLMTCAWAALSPLGRVRIGGAKATPILSRWNWAAITLTTTVAIGILFWATAEPIYHLSEPGGLDVAPGSAAAADFALSSLYLHWSFTPYAIYTVPGLAFALAYHNLRLPFSLASPIQAATGRGLPDGVRDALDGFALLALLFGLAASLGAGILSLSGGLDRIAGTGTGPVATFTVALAVVGGFAASSASGLHRGIRVLSDINTRLFIVVLVFVFVAGPTGRIVTTSLEALTSYAGSFIQRSLLLPPHDDMDWAKAWTVFYWANWLAWAPLSAMFLGRISRGYTVRAYVLVNLVLPALFSIVWMSVFGGVALSIEAEQAGLLSELLRAGGPEHLLYEVLGQLWLGGVLVLAVLLLTYLSYVTAADSNTSVLAELSAAHEDLAPDAPQPRRPVVKIVYAAAVGLAAWSMVSLSGIDGVRMLSNLGGLPALFIVGAFNLALIRMGTKGLNALREA